MKHRLVLEMVVVFSLIAIIDLPRTWAVLGDPATSVETDRLALAGQIQMIPAQRHTIQEITTSDLVLREYVSGNTVFAVTWRGRRPPNLPSLLGAYFQEYQEASADASSTGPVRRGGTRIHAPHLVVETGGHAGDVRGRAYLPSLLPPGVTTEMIQ
ncbi:MAG TPA: DUF2844 domain-containing protein [Nitrospiraceae bacterium]|nr:DUF2844 domain-containing protein [Nitrospiraceae bacterium]